MIGKSRRSHTLLSPMLIFAHIRAPSFRVAHSESRGLGAQSEVTRSREEEFFVDCANSTRRGNLLGARADSPYTRGGSLPIPERPWARADSPYPLAGVDEDDVASGSPGVMALIVVSGSDESVTGSVSEESVDPSPLFETGLSKVEATPNMSGRASSEGSSQSGGS